MRARKWKSPYETFGIAHRNALRDREARVKRSGVQRADGGLPPWLSADRAKGSLLRLRIQPRSSRGEIVGPYGEALKVRLCSPPVDGKANRELTALLSRLLGVANSSVVVIHGASARSKIVAVPLPPEAVLEKLA